MLIFLDGRGEHVILDSSQKKKRKMSEEEEEDKTPIRGLFDFSDGGQYQGEWLGGGAHGYGICSLPGEGGSSFEGYWEGGSQKSGVFTWSSGHKYIGSWQDGMRHGLGREVSSVFLK